MNDVARQRSRLTPGIRGVVSILLVVAVSFPVRAGEDAEGLLQRGLAERALGLDESVQTTRTVHFERAGAAFAAATTTFRVRVQASGSDQDLERAAFARCCQADIALWEGRPKEARTLMEEQLREPLLARGRYHGLSLYYHGVACFQLNELMMAGRSLNLAIARGLGDLLGPTRYLLARVHHRTDERAEALGQYQAVLADYDTRRAAALETLAHPEQVANDVEKARLKTLAEGPPPLHVGRAALHLGTLHYEAGRFGESLSLFADFAKRQPKAPQRHQARLFEAMCDVQLQQYPEAIRTLEELIAADTTLTPLASVWLTKAQVERTAADDRETQVQILREAVVRLKKQLEFVPAHASGRVDVVAQLAEWHEQLGEFKPAADLLASISREQLSDRRVEELLQRRISVLNRAGEYDESERLVERFEKRYPQSMLLPEVLLRHAENSLFLGQAQRTKKADEAARLRKTAAEQYQTLVTHFGDTPQANLARLGLGLLAYRKQEWERTQGLMEAIPAPERNGELAAVPYLIADCHLHLAPTKVDDALAAGKLAEQLGGASSLLEALVADKPEHQLAPDALLRLGQVQFRQAEQIGTAEERNKHFHVAQGTFERVLVEYPQAGLGPLAAFARVKCVARAGGDGSTEQAIRSLRLFTFKPLVDDPIAPLALLHLATLYRGLENRAADAARTTAMALRVQQGTERNYPQTSTWKPLVQYQHAVALMEANRSTEARALFARLRAEHPEAPEAAESLVRLGQCSNEEGGRLIEKGNQLLNTVGNKPADTAAANQMVAEGEKKVRAALTYFEAQLEVKTVPADIRAKLLYEAAWLRRGLAEQEWDAAREEIKKKREDELQKKLVATTPGGQPVPGQPVADVPLGQVELQPSEKRALEQYQQLLASGQETPLLAGVRLELAEFHAQRGRYPEAVALLEQGLDKEPPDELMDKIRLRLGDCLLHRDEAGKALPLFQAVAGREGSSLAVQARFRVGETLLHQGHWEEARIQFVPFRDKEPLQGVAGVSDLALLHLGQVLLHLKHLDEARQAFELVPARFGDSSSVPEARFGIGLSWYQQHKYEQAMEALRPVIGEALTEVACRAHLQIGLCQLELKQYAEALATFIELPTRYPFSDLTALALLEAAYASRKLDQPIETEKRLRQLLHDHPGTRWAAFAREQLKQVNRSQRPDRDLEAKAVVPDFKKPPPLDQLAPQQSDRASLDDPTEEHFFSLILARVPPERELPFASPPLSLPDPFEHREAVRLEANGGDQQLFQVDLVRLSRP